MTIMKAAAHWLSMISISMQPDLGQAMAIRADFTERHPRSRGADGEGYF